MRHYKTKQEIAYELPILDRLSTEERAFLKDLSTKTIEQRLAFSKRYSKEVTALSQDQAVESYRVEVGYVELQRNEMVRVDLESVITLSIENLVLVSLRVHLTGKGTKWLQYLEATNRVPQ